MSVQQSMHTRNHSYQPSLSNDTYKKSNYPTLKRLSNDDEQIVKGDLKTDTKSPGKRRSTSSASSPKMQQQTINSPTDESGVGVANRLCSVCGDASTGIHFGGNSCESCKAFFRRSVQCNRFQNYKCSNEARCPVNIVTRKVCQFCRYTKCTAIGMKPKWVLSDQEREEKYGSRRKRFRENRTSEEDPDIYKYLTSEEKLLIEDIAHALYQSRATYPLQFPNQLNQYLSSLSSETPPTPPPPSPSSSSSSTSEKPPSPSANFLIVPIQRLVLFARMLKDFDLFTEDDKVCLLKGSAIEIMVCSSNTLFNPKTHSFTNYLSRDQRAIMDDQIMPLDPLLIKLWGEELFHLTKKFLISMCNLEVDEVTSTLLAPVILFSPDRSNIVDRDLVERLQIKYVTLIQKYMHWRYGVEHTEDIYPKLLLQIVKIRTLSLAHAEIIQKVMSTSSVNPLVQEVTAKPEILHKSTTDKMDSLSLSSTPNDSDMLDYEKISSIDTESTMGSDDDDTIRKKNRSSIDDDGGYDNEDSNETDLRNIWKKRRKLTITQTEITNLEQNNNSPNLIRNPHNEIKHDFMRSNSNEFEKYSNLNSPQKRPHDHQVPNFVPKFNDDLTSQNRATSLRYLPPKKQSALIKRHNSQEQIYRSPLSSASDNSSHDQYSQLNQISNTTMSPLTKQHYPHDTYENYRQQYNRISSPNFLQQQNEQHLFHLSLANNQSPTPPVQSPANHQSRSGATLDPDEQQLLDAIHAHPNKRDLVLNLLRQMNEPSFTSSMDTHSNINYHNQQTNRTETSNYSNSYRQHSNMDHNNDAF
ncbi:unnamed protein product [Rotaria sordida]|uniref:Uncharacterized protein n=1 Tax=Rotaria sordida TaxID=392033 RepID=A0A818LQ78_9BILA|nr:unnamed protein product [Rotaria sordida]